MGKREGLETGGERAESGALEMQEEMQGRETGGKEREWRRVGAQQGDAAEGANGLEGIKAPMGEGETRSGVKREREETRWDEGEMA